jgi:ribosomal protein S18 acetylase RimI-like enzyme
MKLHATTTPESKFEIKPSPRGVNRPLISRQLARTDFDAIAALQSEVIASVPRGFLRDKTPEELNAFLDGEIGAGFGIFENGTLLAAGFLRTSMANHPYQGPPFPRVPKEDWPNNSAFLENAIVAVAARGRGFQRTLIDLRMAHAKASGVRMVCSGVHLGNEISWRNLLASGMVIVGVKVENGTAVIGLLKSFDDNLLRSSITNLRLVAADDTDGHRDAIERGYIGTRLSAWGYVVYQMGRSSCKQ